MKKIAILGAGNIGMSIAHGILKSDKFKEQTLLLTKRRVDKTESIAGAKFLTDNLEAVKKAEIIIVAVQPGQLFGILDEIQPEIKEGKHIVISVVTGVKLPLIAARFTQQIPICRAMPNTAAAVQQSMTLISSLNNSDDDSNIVKQIFSQMGEVMFTEDNKMGAATILAACGTAFAMRYIRAAMQGGIEIGFDADEAKMIVRQTVMGAAALLAENGLHPESEIDKVTTPMGVTIAGLNEMEHQGFSSALIKGISVSYNKIAKV